MPGAGARLRKAQFLRDGVEVRPEEWEMALRAARKRGVSDPLQAEM